MYKGGIILKLKKNTEKLSFVNFILLTLSGIINGFGITVFLMPVKLYDSGFSGTSMLLSQITPSYLSLSVFLIILNIPLFLYGLKKQGRIFTIYSIYAVIIYSLTSYVITNILPVDVLTSSPIAGNDLLLCALFGGIISGIGSGLTIRFGGALDGIEVLSVIFAKRLGMTVGTFIMIYNVFLYIIAGIVMSDWHLSLYSIITYMAALKTIDFIVEGVDKAKSAMIITTKHEEINKALSEEFGSGITILDAKGYYSSQKVYMIYFVVNRFQISRMKRIVHDIDHNAFVTINDVSEVLHGK